jgi:UDP-glucose 4-epimerase
VGGTRNVLDACVAHGVKHLIVSSSGAAYGYHADNPAWLTETHPLRGNPAFAYSDHKRQVEEMLAH